MSQSSNFPVRKAAGAIVDDGKYYLLQVRDTKDDILWPGKVALWGGATELEDESSFEHTIMRELKEELGLEEDDMDLTRIGSIKSERLTKQLEPVNQVLAVFVAKPVRPLAVHVYEGTDLLKIKRLTPLSDIDTTNFAPGVTESIEALNSYYEHQD